MRTLLAISVLNGALLAGMAAPINAQPAGNPNVAELLEDNGADLIKFFNNPGGEGGQALLETNTRFSGKSCVKVIPLQRYSPDIPGWSYRITEKPKPGEYRYLRFAWKAEGCAGIMVQFPHQKIWELRYTAGQNQYGWATKFVAAKAPGEWQVVTCDMFADFGERTLTGIALTVFGGTAGYFDHIYLARSIDDLDRIDATGLRKGQAIELSADDLRRLWTEVAGPDAARAYLAFWTLVAAPKHTIPFVEKKLTDKSALPDLTQIKKWIAQLDDNKFTVREAAAQHLAQHLDNAAALLEQELAKKPSLEVSLRIEKLLALRKGPDWEKLRVEKSIQALEFMGTPEAAKCLTRLAKDGNSARVTAAAGAALKRLEAGTPK